MAFSPNLSLLHPPPPVASPGEARVAWRSSSAAMEAQRRRPLRPSAAAVQATKATWRLRWSSGGGWRCGSGRPDLISWIWSGFDLNLDALDVGGRRSSWGVLHHQEAMAVVVFSFAGGDRPVLWLVWRVSSSSPRRRGMAAGENRPRLRSWRTMMTSVRRYLVEGIISATCVLLAWASHGETPDPGLPARTMAACGAGHPAGGIVFGADNG